jgi:hypothetical protein
MPGRLADRGRVTRRAARISGVQRRAASWRWPLAAAGVAAGAGSAAAFYRQVVSGRLTLDVGVGRRLAPLGPLTVDVEAPRELVFDVIAAPYLGKAGAAGDHIEVLDRGTDLVVAAHRTALGRRVATTVESVAFDRPSRITFRLLRGPVPHVVEVFELDEHGGGTRLRYEGEIGTDFWWAGAAWGAAVQRVWVRTVRSSLQEILSRSEDRAASHRRRASRG